MAITKTVIGQNPDGSPRFHVHSDGHVLLTGPIKGTVTTSDGTVYDVSDDVIEIPTGAGGMVPSGQLNEDGTPHLIPGHAVEVADLIGDRYQVEGHRDHIHADPPSPFRHDKHLSFGRSAAATPSEG